MADNEMPEAPDTPDRSNEVLIRGPQGQEYAVTEPAFTDLYEPDGYQIVADFKDGVYVYRNPEEDPSYVAPAEGEGKASVPAQSVPTNGQAVTTLGDGTVIPVVNPDGSPAETPPPTEPEA